MNYMSEIAKMLGVELGEEFKISEFDEYIFEFSKTGMLCQVFPSLELGLDITLIDILKGKYNIVKISKSVLTDKEKAYLSSVIRPFRNRIKYICKNNNEDGDTEFLDVQLDDNDFMAFPNFKKGTMYKGMELGMGYTLEELSL